MSANFRALRSLRDENKRLKNEIYYFQASLNHLHQVIHALNTLQYQIDAITPETDVVALIHQVLSAALEAVDSENGSLLLLDEKKEELVFVNVIGLSRDALMGYRMPADEGLAGWIIKEKSPVLVHDARKDERWSSNVDEAVGFHTVSMIGVPLLDGGRSFGVIEVLNPFSRGSFREGDLDVMILVARLASLCLVRAEEVSEK